MFRIGNDNNHVSISCSGWKYTYMCKVLRTGACLIVTCYQFQCFVDSFLFIMCTSIKQETHSKLSKFGQILCIFHFFQYCNHTSICNITLRRKLESCQTIIVNLGCQLSLRLLLTGPSECVLQTPLEHKAGGRPGPSVHCSSQLKPSSPFVRPGITS